MAEPGRDDVAAFPETLIAVCLDTNSMSKGRLNVAAVEELADVIDSQELEAQVWVPEPVVWEWAEHLTADLEAARETYLKACEGARAAGTAEAAGGSWETAVDIDPIIDGMVAAIEDLEGVHVLHLSGNAEAAVHGLRDQVLGQGAGRSKSNVKTGAADSTSFRLAEAQLSKYGGTMVVVSADQDARRHFAGRPGIVLVNSLSRTRAGIVAMRTGSAIAAERVRESIALRLPTMFRVELQGAAVLGETQSPSRRSGRVLETVLELVSIDSVQNVRDLDVSYSNGYAAAVVEGCVAVERSLQVLSEINGQVEMDVETFDNLDATIEVSAESNDGVSWDLVVDSVAVGA